MASKKFCVGPGITVMFFVALRANQMMKTATKALTKMEFDSHSINGSPWDERNIVGASSVSADARIVENGMIRTSRFQIRDFHGRLVSWRLAFPISKSGFFTRRSE